MPAQHPSVMQGQYHRELLAEPRKRPQVEISPVEIVAMQDMRALRNEIRELPSPLEIEILDASPPVKKMTWLA